MRTSSPDELRQLSRGIRKSFAHLETGDSYGTETELPHLARWRLGEPDDYAWLEWWLEMLREHRAAVTKQRDQYAEPNRRFRHGNGHDEQREYLAVVVAHSQRPLSVA